MLRQTEYRDLAPLTHVCHRRGAVPAPLQDGRTRRMAGAETAPLRVADFGSHTELRSIVTDRGGDVCGGRPLHTAPFFLRLNANWYQFSVLGSRRSVFEFTRFVRLCVCSFVLNPQFSVLGSRFFLPPTSSLFSFLLMYDV
jgi:hypothetical protein